MSKTDKIIHFSLGGAVMIAGIILKSWIGLAGLIPVIAALTGLSFLPGKRK
jgi:hypothetical protein